MIITENSESGDSKRLAVRIWTIFPVTQHAFAKLLGLLEIGISREIATACVTFGARSRLLINPDFLRDHCATDEALVMLVMHELYHIVLGHTRLWSRTTLAQNWAFDAVINAQLCLLFPQPANTAFFRKFYSAESFPEFLLRPPEGWGSEKTRWKEGPRGAAHKALYSDLSISYEALFELLTHEIGNQAPGKPELDPRKLLGNHSSVSGDAAEEYGDEHSDSIPADILDEVRNIIAEWPMIKVRSGRDSGGQGLRDKVNKAKARRDAVSVIRNEVLKLADKNAGIALPTSFDSETDGVLAYQTGRDRRAAVRMMAGEHPFFYAAQLVNRVQQQGERVHVYLDVSGSMEEVIAPLYAALFPVLPWIEPQVHLFSTDVNDVNHAELRRRVRISTGGTDICVVSSHILENDVKRAVIVTDGWVGFIPHEHLLKLKAKRVKIRGVITDPGSPSFCFPAGVAYSTLPRLD